MNFSHRNRMVVNTIVLCLCFTHVGNSFGDEGFFTRINPWRKTAAAPSASAPVIPVSPMPATQPPASETVEPATFGQGFSLSKLGQIFQGPSTASAGAAPTVPPTTFDSAAIQARVAQMSTAGAHQLDQKLPSVEQYRQQMQAQGYDTATIEAGIAQMTAAGAQNIQQRLPSIDEVRAKMQAQGYDTAAIEARISQLAAAGQLGMQAIESYGGQLPSLEQVKSQMQAQGYDQAAIQAKLGELAQSGAKTLTENLPTAEHVRAQMHAQGYDTAAIEARITQLSAAGQIAAQTWQTISPPTTPVEPPTQPSEGTAIGQMFNWWNKK